MSRPSFRIIPPQGSYFIIARQDAKCSYCGEPIAKGDIAYWYPKCSAIECKQCGDEEEDRLATMAVVRIDKNENE